MKTFVIGAVSLTWMVLCAWYTRIDRRDLLECSKWALSVWALGIASLLLAGMAVLLG